MTASDEHLLFVPLGGTEEIGMNFNLYGLGEPDNEEWIIVDMGVTFGDDATPGVDVILPDPAFIEERADRLAGIVLTHGHEDHLGAVPYLWSRLQCPVYATPFTAALLRRKLELDAPGQDIEIIEVPLSGKFEVGRFDLELITLTHSMPEPNAVVLRAPQGIILHTGDWKFDPDPVIGPTADEKALKALGDEGVLAAIGDSTNVFVEGSSHSEAALLDSLTSLIGECGKQVAVTCFASNVARLQTIFDAAAANGRAVALVGRSLWRINAAARQTGYLTDLPPFLEAEDAVDIPADQILYICTGSQGEPRAALSRIAGGDHRHVTLGEGDAVIFSSRQIPGNELAIGRLQNQLARKGVRIISEMDHFVHVSGHPARDELTRMYQHLRPQVAIPVHGEQRHLIHHTELALSCQVPEAVLVHNGAVVELTAKGSRIVDEVQAGRLVLDGDRIVSMESDVVRDRIKIMYNGAVSCSVVVDDEGELAADPIITAKGLIEDDDAAYDLAEAAADVRSYLGDLDADEAEDDAAIEKAAHLALRRFFRSAYGKRPVISVHVVRI